ncbi:RNA-binding protein musashi [Plasmodium brasilianum]|uniref:RNA-binding protein musashi, putative n=2 Tax=Plasmodium (Plasmodium) TaxID=418103 RepID=A0A1A8VWQ3_PLAMA|nr:RNA-binding protein musashi, putative [Plasmodium malariae]KAI4839403.1 RNA-binding protein musashi [Plasmodium brasilianum]SBS83778.1 RNA-binding protein musashi, putative [Plasmodium malariae]SBT87821.1 RNA-binding protein musashi, putative [Plasmodium malariae]
MTSEENVNYNSMRSNSHSSQDKKSVEHNSNEKVLKEDESEVEKLRRLIAPLSKEQLIDILATCALTHQDIREKCNEAVASSPSTRRLMIRNIPFSTRDDQFLKYFEAFGEIEDGIIVREKEGRSKGYGFVTFKYVESVQKCLKSSHTLDNKELQVRLVADPFTDHYQNKLFVRNLSQKTNVGTLRDIFEKYGKLEECVIIHDNEGKSKGYGFLTFSSPKEAFKVMQQPERIIDNRVVFLHFAVSQNYKKYQNNQNYIKKNQNYNYYQKNNMNNRNNFVRRAPVYHHDNDSPNTFNYPVSFVPNVYTNVPQGYQLNYPGNMDSFNAFYNNPRY